MSRVTHPLPAAAILLALSILPAPAHAQSLTGTWTVTTEGRGGQINRTLVLTQDGSALRGTMTFAFAGGRGGGAGGAAGGGQNLSISEGSVEGSSFRFTLTVDVQGTTITQRYSGTFEGDTMQGQIEGGRGGSQPFTGRRSR
jgi:hypothetical protein